MHSPRKRNEIQSFFESSLLDFFLFKKVFTSFLIKSINISLFLTLVFSNKNLFLVKINYIVLSSNLIILLKSDNTVIKYYCLLASISC